MALNNRRRRRERQALQPQFIRVWVGAGAKVEEFHVKNNTLYRFVKASLCPSHESRLVVVATYRRD